MKKIFFAVLLLLAACTSLQVVEESHSAAGSKYVLGNGITVLMKENHNTGLVAIDALFKVGLTQEPKPGMNNFVAKMLLRGTKKRTGEDILSQIENVGGSISSRTFAEYCEIGIVVPSEYFSVGLEILKDIIMNSEFSVEEFEKTKAKILDELKAKEDDPNIVEEELFMKALYDKHPYANPIDGFIDSVKTITRDELVEHYRKWFSPNNLFIGIAGNFYEKPTIRALAYLFRDFKKQPFEEKLIFAEPLKSKRVLTKNKLLESFFINYGFLISPVTSPDFVRMRVVTSALGSGVSSRMFTELRGKRGLGYLAYAKQPSVRINGFIKMVMIVRPSVLNQSLKGIQDLVDEIKTEKMSEKELTHVKNKMKGFYLLAHQESKEQANFLAFYEMQGVGYDYDVEYPKKIDSVSVDDVYAVANKYLNNPAIAITGPFSVNLFK
ncbi:hypothetical protein B6U93_02215 [Candidatus Woesearchaeota archaeon ex4484_78]|nr:MAG: hypothetical protein B6U93_02215 [Candidatus Woesearchaeota archaeon ex4484_78]